MESLTDRPRGGGRRSRAVRKIRTAFVRVMPPPGRGGVGRVLLLLVTILFVRCGDGSITHPDPQEEWVEAQTWSTWSGLTTSDLPLPLPGDDPALAQLSVVVEAQAELSEVDRQRIMSEAGPPTRPWTEELADMLDHYNASLPGNRVATPVRAARAGVLLHAAIHDALLLSWQVKMQNRRPPPAEHPEVDLLVDSEGVPPGFGSEHAAAAIAAARVLAFVFPEEDPEALEAHALRRARDAMRAGVAWPEDVEAGLLVGEAVAGALLEWAASDGSDAEWDGVRPDGPEAWQPTPPQLVEVPYEVAAGSWRTWVLEDASAHRPPPPPLPGSADFEVALAEVQGMAEQVDEDRLNRALFWATSPPSMRWHLFVEEGVERSGLSSLRAARVHLLASVAMYEAYVAVWEAKYHYWLLRPITADPELSPLFPTPHHPSYPSGHSAISASIAHVLTTLLPRQRTRWDALAEEASESRIWGLVHYRFDLDAGKELGLEVGRGIIDWMEAESFSH